MDDNGLRELLMSGVAARETKAKEEAPHTEETPKEETPQKPKDDTFIREHKAEAKKMKALDVVAKVFEFIFGIIATIIFASINAFFKPSAQLCEKYETEKTEIIIAVILAMAMWVALLIIIF